MVARILVVEDDKNIRLLMSTLFRKRGYEVEEAENGLEALRTVVSDPNFDIVVTDMQMPTLNGRKLIETLKTYYPNLYVVAISAHDASIGDASTSGADSSIHKPFSYYTLVDIIDDIARRLLNENVRH